MANKRYCDNNSLNDIKSIKRTKTISTENQKTRMLSRISKLVDEYSSTGQQVVVMLSDNDSEDNLDFKILGSQPLQNVIKNIKQQILGNLESVEIEETIKFSDTSHDLPPLTIDGMPISLEKMTQAQLRTFIPTMLKFSTGRSKPGWGRDSTRPPWWPKNIPWANVRQDIRSEEEKKSVHWTNALREIVVNCYKYHGREDLLPETDVNEYITTDCENSLQEYYIQPEFVSSENIQYIQINSNKRLITLPDGTIACIETIDDTDNYDLSNSVIVELSEEQLAVNDTANSEECALNEINEDIVIKMSQ